MCCGQVSRPTSQVVKQTEIPAQTGMQNPRQSDTSNPVVSNSTNIARANEVRRNNYHQQHFGGR